MRLIALERSKQNLAKLQEIGFPRRGRTPRKPDLALRLRFNEAKEFYALIAHLDVDRNFGQQRDAITARDHL